MNEIKCPKCGTTFQLDETVYESIIKQIRDSEFEKQIHESEKRFETEKETAIRLKEAELEKNYQHELSKKNEEVSKLRLDIENNNRNKELE